MLSELVLKLNVSSNLVSWRSGSAFHGVLMENIDSSYADILHQSHQNIFSQWIEQEKDNIYWHICGLNKEAYEKIILPLSALDEFFFYQKDTTIQVTERTIRSELRKEFVEKYLFSTRTPYVSFYFATPTAFKQEGEYVNYPQVRLIFQSLMKRFDYSGNEKIFSYDLLELITENLRLQRYSLRSGAYPLEKVNIPSFQGYVSYRIKGPKEFSNLVNLLTQFAVYSGVGVKTGLGMGAIGRERKQNG